MTVTRVGGDAQASTTSVTSIAVTLPTVADGDIGLISHGYNPVAGATTTPAGWTLQSTIVVTSTAYVAVYRKTLAVADSGGSVVFVNGGAQRLSAALGVYRGGTFSTLGTFAETTSGTTHTNPSGTAPTGGAVAISMISERSTTPSTAFTQPSGFTLRNTAFGTGSGAESVGMADNLTAVAAGSTAGGGTWGASTANPAVGTATAFLIPATVSPLTVSLAVVPTSGVAPLVVAATATPSGGNGNTISYTFDWDDTTTTGPQSGATAGHTYSVAGEYDVTVTASQP